MIKKFLVVSSIFCVLFSSAQTVSAQRSQPISPKGAIFNESEWIVDAVTGRPTLRLTKNRNFNHIPTYHLNACFSNDSRYIIFSTISKGYGSALIHADVTNGDCRVIAASKDEKAFRYFISLIPGSDYAASSELGTVTVFNLKTLEERVLYKAPQGEYLSHPEGSPDGKKIYVNQLSDDLGEKGAEATNRMSIIEIDIASGKSKLIFSDESRGKHVIANPVNPDLLLINRDFPPNFAKGSDNGKTTREWILNIKTGALTECRPNNPSRFTLHSNWSYDGKYVYYHGEGSERGTHYIGVADLNGKVVWEATFPYFYYGHMCSHTQKHALFTDGLLFPNLITELDWTKPDKNNVPPIVIYGAHNSGSHTFGQHTHPHCHMSPDAQKVAYNKGSEKHSDIYILFIEN